MVPDDENGQRHVCWHRQIAEIAEHVYYACSCGSRMSGRRAAARAHRTEVDQEWLDGADRDPR